MSGIRLRHAERTARWKVLACAVVFVVAAEAGAIGNRLSGQWSIALVVFAVLVMIGAGITYWLERGDSSGGVPGVGEGAPGGQGRHTFDQRAARGVQVGDHNQQRNYFGPRSAPGPHWDDEQ